MFGNGLVVRDVFDNIFMDFRDESHKTDDVRWNDRITYDDTWENNVFNFLGKVLPRLTAEFPKNRYFKAAIQRRGTQECSQCFGWKDTVLNQVTLILKMKQEKVPKKVTKKTIENQMLILNNMQQNVWYKASDFEDVVAVKESRIKELLKDLLEQGKIEATGSTKGKMYRKC